MKGTIITAPNIMDTSRGDTAVFIAGGISDCPDWQAAVCDAIAAELPYAVINPRRNNWDMKAHREESIKQITWEFMHLDYSKHILFWFPSETLCPITLLELGKYLARTDVELTIGTHPNYGRRLDVEVQTKLERPSITIWDNLDSMVADFIQQHKRLHKPE